MKTSDFRTFRIQKEVVEEHSRQLLVMSFKALDEENKGHRRTKTPFLYGAMGKIKAFTILELMVTMVLISVAIAVAMVVLQMVQTQFSRFEQSGHRHSELFLLNTMLKRDFMRSAEIYRGQNTLLFLGFEDTVTYSINPETNHGV